MTNADDRPPETAKVSAPRNGGANRPFGSKVLGAVLIFWLIGQATFFFHFDIAIGDLPLVRSIGLAGVIFVSGTTVALIYTSSRMALRRPFGFPEWAMAAMLAVVGLSFVWFLPSKNLDLIKLDLWHILFAYLMPFGAYFSARLLPSSPSTQKNVVLALVLAIGGYALTFGLMDYLTDWTFFQRTGAAHVHAERVKGFLPDAIKFGVLVGLLFIMTLALDREKWPSLIRWSIIVIGGALLLFVFFSKARSVWLGLAFALLYLIVRGDLGWRSLAKFSAVAGILYVLIHLVASGPFPTTEAPPSPSGAETAPHGENAAAGQISAAERFVETGSIDNRIGSVATALAMIAERPLFGYGIDPNAYAKNKEEFLTIWFNVRKADALYPNHPHNELLTKLVQMGIVGLAAFLTLLAAIFLMLCNAERGRTPPRDWGPRLAIHAEAMLLFLGVNGMLHDVGYMSRSVVLFFFVAGLVRRATLPVPTRHGRDG